MKTNGLSIKMGYIKTLFKATSGKMMHCKEAIDEVLANNKTALTDTQIIEKAMVIMNDKKQAVANKKVSNDTNFFAIFFEKNPVEGSNKGILLKFGCESEQGVKTLKEKYSDVLQKITEKALEIDAESTMDILGIEWDKLSTISIKLKEISGTLSEKVELVSVEFAESIPETTNTYVDHYIHKTNSGDRGAAILIYNYKDKLPEKEMRNILHQVVMSRPLYLKANEVLKSIEDEVAIDIRETIAKDNARYDEITAKKANLEIADKLGDALKTELDEITEELKSGKTKKIPEKAFEGTIKGKLNKFKKEICLETQDYMFAKDQGLDKQTTVETYLKTLGVTIFDMVVI